jgi:hypothetical protein
VCSVAAEERLNAGGELVVVERLAEVVIGADPKTHDAVGWVVLRGKEEDRNVGVAAELKAEADAVDGGHQYIERDQVGVEGIECLHRLTRVGDRLHLVSCLFEDCADEARDILIVVDNEDPAPQSVAAAGGGSFLVQHL